MAIPSTHQALVHNQDKSISLKVVKVPIYGDLLVQVKAVALNPTDYKHNKSYPRFPVLQDQAVLGSDYAGIVLDSKNPSSPFTKGDRVAGHVAYKYGIGDFVHNGSFSEYVAADSQVTWKIPDNLSFEPAAALGGISSNTAGKALFSRIDIPRPWDPTYKSTLQKGDPILIWSGAASVSFYAVQIAAQAGLVVYTTASSKHHELLKSLGATYVYDYKHENVSEEIYNDSKGAIQYALDGITGWGSTQLVVDSLSKEKSKVVTLLPLEDDDVKKWQARNSDVKFVSVVEHLDPSFTKDRADIKEFNNYFAAGLAQGVFKVASLDVRHGLENISAGLDELEEGNVSGKKIVYTI